MDNALRLTKTVKSIPSQNNVALLAFASTVAFAAAGSLLGYSLLSSRKKRPLPGQISLGVLLACAGAVTWLKRREEAAAARHLVDHVHRVQNARWLKKNPIAYG